ncbi:M56 family metallopeptidase [Hymenobacter koreensis]|uniref:Peptidase M56 domain-containing protein n=1 Tax=Hymenobacter koreensis TaxID=1084523 RepID=A0ABP8IVQ3_9BACT
MNWLETLLTPALVRAVGYTLLHSLWQGALVALALAGLLLLLRRHSAQVRYTVTAASLGLILLLACVTFTRYYLTAPQAVTEAAQQVQVPSAAYEAAVAEAPAAHPLSKQVVLAYIEHNLPLIVTLWLLGLLTMTLRLLGGLAYVQRLRHYGTRPLGLAWQHRLANLSERAGLKRPVALLESSLVRVPVVIGHLKPMILLPLGAVAGLSPAQMEAILAHELAHVARRDYLINIIQSVAEILFFYHPAVWFLTATLRSERENCCDDVAASLCGDPLVLARALAALAELGLERTAAPRLTMAAVGPRGSLLGRVRRLVQGRGAPTFSEGFMAACVVMMGMVVLCLSAVAALAHPHLAAAAPRLLRQALPALTVPAAPPAPLAPLAPQAPQAPSNDDDDDRKRKAKRQRGKDTQLIVVDRNTASSRRGAPGSVIIEKDKKGRLKELYVNGQRIETDTPDRRGGKKDDERVQIVQMPASDYVRYHTLPGSYTYINNSSADKELDKAFKSKVRKEFEKGFKYKYETGSDGNVRVFRLDPDVDEAALVEHSLRDATRSLERALSDRNLSDGDRERMEEKLSELRGRLEMQDEVRRDADERRREADAVRREADARRREEAAVRREAEARRREEAARVREERARERAERSRIFEEKFVGELRRDGLITDTRNFNLVLTNSSLTLNGKQQPETVLRKYLKIYREVHGSDMTSTGSMSIARNGTDEHVITRDAESYSYMPAPPRPPRAPSAPSAPSAPRAPRAPRAPQAPKTTFLNSVDIRSELLRDQLINSGDRTLQFRLNNKEMVVNGKAQPAEVAERYRKLLGGAEGSRSVNMDIVIDND